MFEQVLDCIKSYNTIIIHRHSSPDGDALGSQIGLKNIILESFPEKTVYVVGDGSVRYAFMEGAEMDDIGDEVFHGALSIILDTSASALICDSRYTLAEKTVRIDHHIFCEKIADIEVTDTSFESCCGMITSFARECNLKLNVLAAKSLYTGMVTDSGRFKFDSTNERTFLNAAHLISYGFDTAEIFRNLYVDDLSFIQLRAQFALKIKQYSPKVLYIYTSLEELKSYQADIFTISRGMVAVMGDIRGVDAWVNFTETENGVLCEIRSGRYNINPIAVKYGGGGHAKASGATLKNKEQAMEMLADINSLVEKDQ